MSIDRSQLKAVSLCYKGLQKERIAISNRLRNFNIPEEDIAHIKELLKPALRDIKEIIKSVKVPALGLVSAKIVLEYLERTMGELCEQYLA